MFVVARVSLDRRCKLSAAAGYIHELRGVALLALNECSPLCPSWHEHVVERK